MKKKTQAEIIEEFGAIHGDLYDYSKVEYVDMHTVIEVICSVHGSFFPKPQNHKNGSGCRKCADEANGNNYRTSVEEFIYQANKVHGNVYDYSLVKQFKTQQDKIEILCPKHGKFEQKAYSHLAGKGCMECSQVALKEKFIANRKNVPLEPQIKIEPIVEMVSVERVEVKSVKEPAKIQEVVSSEDVIDFEMTKEDFIYFYNEHNTGKTGLNGTFVKNRFPNVYDWVMETTGFLGNDFSFSERTYCILNGITEAPICVVCGKPTHLNAVKSKGWRKSCSTECYDLLPNKGKAGGAGMKRKAKEHPEAFKETRIKFENTSMKLYGTKNPMFNSEIAKKQKENQWGVK